MLPSGFDVDLALHLLLPILRVHEHLFDLLGVHLALVEVAVDLVLVFLALELCLVDGGHRELFAVIVGFGVELLDDMLLHHEGVYFVIEVGEAGVGHPLEHFDSYLRPSIDTI